MEEKQNQNVTAQENTQSATQPKEEKQKKSVLRGLLKRPSPLMITKEEKEQAQQPQEPAQEKEGLLQKDSPFVLNEEERKAIEQAQLPMDEEEPFKEKEEKAPVRKKHLHWYGVPVGTVVLCLALVGAIFLGTQAYNYIYARITDDSTERAYDTYLSPVVMLDPQPFESMAAAEKEMMLQAAVWKTVFDYASGFSDYDESARMIFPGGLVRSCGVQLFGVDCILPTNDLYLPGSGVEEGQPEGTVSYDASQDKYHVPLIGTIGNYRPYTVSVRKKGNVELLKVAYCIVVNLEGVLPNASQSTMLEDDELIHTPNGDLQVIKYMEYEISYDDDTKLQYISAIRSLGE